MEKTDLINALAEDPHSYLEEIKQKNATKVIGFVCSYAPEEMILAAGALPVRLLSATENPLRADLHFQSYGCSLARSILDAALAGRLDYLDGVVFPHTCDTIQRLSDIWRINLPQTFFADVVLPVKLTSPAARQYLMDVLEKFRGDLEAKLGTKISDAKLQDVIRLYNVIRLHLSRLNELRRTHPGLISGRDYSDWVTAAMRMDRVAYLALLEAFVADMAQAAAGHPASNAKKLVLAGGGCTTPDIYGLIEEAGGVVVDDDLCMGTRYYEALADESLPPLVALADRLIKRPVCPAKHAGLTKRADDLIARVRRAGADGVIFILLKFCDPHAFDYPYMKEMLDRENIPSLLLEMESDGQAGGQLQTRLETYMEII